MGKIISRKNIFISLAILIIVAAVLIVIFGNHSGLTGYAVNNQHAQNNSGNSNNSGGNINRGINLSNISVSNTTNQTKEENKTKQKYYGGYAPNNWKNDEEKNKTKVHSLKNLKNGLALRINGSEFNLGSVPEGRFRFGLYKGNAKVSEFDLDLTSDVDLSDIISDSDAVEGKAFMHSISGMLQDISLFVPRKPGQNAVVICVNASSFEQIHEGCANEIGVTAEYVVREGDSNVKISEDGNYFIVYNITGTGGEGIVLATDAEHLDKDKNIISNIYDSIKEKDNIWSEQINPEEYARVKFERNLTNKNDITIYARPLNGSAQIEVYAENRDSLIVTFTNISQEGLYKVFLTGLANSESYDTFDLKILNSAVSFDYITDPANDSYISMSPPNGAKVIFINSSRETIEYNQQSVDALAGNVTELDVFGNVVTQSWQGYYGNVTGVISLEDSEGHILYNWSDLSPSGEVYASRSGSINFASIACANPIMVNTEEGELGQNNNDGDSIANTFNKNFYPQFYVGSVQIEGNNCSSTNINSADPNAFYEVLLSDDSANLVYTSILEQDLTGFDLRLHDFEMIVPENGHNGDTSTTPYYFFTEIG